MYTVLYIEDGNHSHETFPSKEEALKFCKKITSSSKKKQHIKFILGLVVGEYIHAALDYKEEFILDKLREDVVD